MITIANYMISFFGIASFIAKATQVVVVRRSRMRRTYSICLFPLGVLQATAGGCPVSQSHQVSEEWLLGEH